MTVQDVDNAFRKKAESNVKLYVIRKKIENGTATMEDMSEYSNILCKLLGKTLGENISGVPESERAKFCEWLLRNQYEDTNERLATVQRFLDKKQNIHIAAKKPKFPAERVRKAAHSLEDKTVSEEVIQRRAENAVANIANSFHDDYIKENAEFRQNAGLKCHVTRIGAFECCAWCAEVAGRYEVGKEPADFWRRHDNCTCRMNYENQKVRQRLSGQGKGWKVDSEVQRRQAQRIEYKPTRLNQEQAKALESEKLSQIKGLTIAGKTDIMKEKKDSSSDKIQWLPKGKNMSKEEFRELRDYASSKGIALTGFKTSDADTQLIKNEIDSISKIVEMFPELMGNKRKPLTLALNEYMDSNDFAMTSRRMPNIVQLNADAFRNKEKLEEEYDKLVQSGWFVQGTNYKSIVKHELGHLYQAVHHIKDEEIVQIAMNVSEADNKKDLFQFLKSHLSTYSSDFSDGSEIISEVFSDFFSNTVPTEFSQKFMKKLFERSEENDSG